MKLVFLKYWILIIFIFLVNSDLQSQSTSTIRFEQENNAFVNIEHALENENWKNVGKLCDSLLQKESSSKISGIAHFYKGEVKFLNGNLNDSKIYYEDALQFFKSSHFEKGLAHTYSQLSDIEFQKRNLKKSLDLANQSIFHAKSLQLYDLLINNLQKKATIFSNQQEIDSTILSLKQALFYKPKDAQRKTILNQISTNYQANGQLDSAIVYFKKDIDLKKKLNDSQGLISDYCALGNLHKERGAYLKGQNNLVFALEIAESKKDTFALITVYLEMGDIYAVQKVWPTAKKHYTKAIKFAKAKNNIFSKASGYQKLGILYQKQNQDSLSIKNYEQSLKLFDLLHSKVRKSEILIQLSKLSRNNSQFSKTKKYLLQALDLRKHSHDQQSSFEIKMALGEIELLHGNFNKGTAYINDCLSHFKQTKNKQGLAECYELLSKANAKKGNYQKAYGYQKQFELQNDSQKTIEIAKTINEVELRYETEKRDKEIAEKEVEINVQKIQIQKRNAQLGLLLGGLIIMGLLAMILFFFYQKNKIINAQKLAVLEKEKETQNLKSIIIGEEKERKRMARELHDGLGAVLATVKMGINGIQNKYPEIGDLPSYQKAENLIDEACKTVREISHDLMPFVLEQHGIEFAIDDMCQTLRNGQSIQFHFYFFGDENTMSDIFKITTFRITQELLKNAIKHSEAKEVIVQLTIENSILTLIVEDDGIGFDEKIIKKGLGLENIRSRIEYLNGKCTIDSTPNEGSTFTIEFHIDTKKTKEK